MSRYNGYESYVTVPKDVQRYEVTHVWGSMIGRLEVGWIIRDTGNTDSPRIWQIFDLASGEASGGFEGKRIGTVDRTAEVSA